MSINFANTNSLAIHVKKNLDKYFFYRSIFLFFSLGLESLGAYNILYRLTDSTETTFSVDYFVLFSEEVPSDKETF